MMKKTKLRISDHCLLKTIEISLDFGDFRLST